MSLAGVTTLNRLFTSAKEDMFFVIVCLLATLRKNVWTDLSEIFREGRQWANEQTILVVKSVSGSWHWQNMPWWSYALSKCF